MAVWGNTYTNELSAPFWNKIWPWPLCSASRLCLQTRRGGRKRRKRGLSKSAFCPPSYLLPSLGHLFQLSGNPANEMLLQRISLHFKSSLSLSLSLLARLFGESIRSPFRRHSNVLSQLNSLIYFNDCVALLPRSGGHGKKLSIRK